MNFQPYPSRTGFIFAAIAAFGGGIALLLLRTLLQQPQTPAELFILLLQLLAVLAVTGLTFYWAIVAFNLNYHLNRNGLMIQWGLSRQLIPIHTIKTVIPGSSIDAPLKFRGLNLGGLRLGRAKLAEYGSLRFRTTAPLDHSLVVVTPLHAYVISPRQPDTFIQAWQSRQQLGATQQWSHQIRRRWPFNLPLLLDPWTWGLMGAAGLVCFMLFGYLALNYAQLPPAIPIHFDSLGRADRIATKAEIFIFPAVGALVLIFNALLGSLIYRREKVAAYLLWGSALLMQLYLWMAILRIIP